MSKYLTISPKIFYFPPNFSQVAPKFLRILHKIIIKITQKSEKYLQKHTFKFPENFSNSFHIYCCARIIWICVVSSDFYYWHRYSLNEILEKFQRNFAWHFFQISFKFLWKNISNFSRVFQFFLFFCHLSMNGKCQYLSITVPIVSILIATSLYRYFPSLFSICLTGLVAMWTYSFICTS